MKSSTAGSLFTEADARKHIRFILVAGGRGARILNACNLQSISYGVVVVFENVTRHFERYLKDRKKMAPHLSCFCPACLSELTLF